MALLRVKQQMLLAGVYVKDANAVHVFLHALDDDALDPYMKNPFEWDAQHYLLSSSWLVVESSVVNGHECIAAHIL